MKINKIEFHNFRGLANCTLELEDQLTVLIGENGVGKSSILHALSHLMHPYTSWAKSGSGSHYSLKKNDLKFKANECSISMDMEFSTLDPHSPHIERVCSEFDAAVRNQKFEYSSLMKYLQAREQKEISHERLTPTLFYSIDQSRSGYQRIQSGSNKFADKNFDRETAYQETIDSLDLFESWFGQRDAKSARTERKNRGYVDPQLAAVQEAIASSTNFKLRYEEDPPRGLRAYKGDVELTMDQLSAGECVMMLMVGHIAMRLGLLNRDDPVKANGIVLIDEIELHLHPSWQRKILPLLLKTFPNVQFIVSTHSPQVVGEIRGDCLRMVRRVDNNNYSEINYWNEETYGQDSNTLLNTLFQSSEMNSDVSDKIDSINSLIESGDIEEAEIMIKKTINYLGYEPVDLTISLARIARRK